MPSCWIEKRASSQGIRYRVRFRVGGRESVPRFGGTFGTKREADIRRAWVLGEFAAMRIPNLALLAEPRASPRLRDAAVRWQASRVDIRESTRIQHGTAVGRLLKVLGDRRIDTLTPADVADLVAAGVKAENARETIRKTVTALAMILDFAGVSPNPARDRVHVRLPREEPDDIEPPSAAHVEAVGWLLQPAYLLALLVLDTTGCRVGEFEAAKVGNLDECRRAWLVRAAVAKTRRARWVPLPDDLYSAVLDRLPAREDRDADAPLFPGVTADRLRVAIGRACRDGGTPHFSPHALRHRRISLLHRTGVSWAEIGDRVGQRSRLVTADTYSHAMLDSREVNRAKLLERVSHARLAHTPVHTRTAESPVFAGRF